MSQSLTLVLQSSVSLRATATIFVHLPRLSYDPQGDWPTAGTIQMWLLRLGLDALKQPLEPADDWAWLADHTVQIGKTKCLLIVGVRLSKWRELGGELTHHELSVIALEPVEHSDGETVHRQLNAAVHRTGVPRMIASDHGSDLKKGIEAFGQQHPQVASSYDIAHKVALLLKKMLEGDARWAEFTQQCGQTKSRLQQTSLAHLIPPSAKPKARYMNADGQVQWGLRVLQRLDRHATSSPNAVGEKPAGQTSSASVGSLSAEKSTNEKSVNEVPDVSRDVPLGVVNPSDTPRGETCDEAGEEESTDSLEEKLGWVRAFAGSLARWSILMTIVAISRNFVRQQGYYTGAAEQLRRELSAHGGDEMGDQLIDQVCCFVSAQSALAAPGERLLGSTEILESLIGKGKQLEGQQSKGGFTKMILSLAAATVAPTVERIKTALDRTMTKHVLDWVRTHIPRSLQAQRRADLPPLPSGTKTG